MKKIFIILLMLIVWSCDRDTSCSSYSFERYGDGKFLAKEECIQQRQSMELKSYLEGQWIATKELRIDSRSYSRWERIKNATPKDFTDLNEPSWLIEFKSDTLFNYTYIGQDMFDGSTLYEIDEYFIIDTYLKNEDLSKYIPQSHKIGLSRTSIWGTDFTGFFINKECEYIHPYWRKNNEHFSCYDYIYNYQYHYLDGWKKISEDPMVTIDDIIRNNQKWMKRENKLRNYERDFKEKYNIDYKNQTGEIKYHKIKIIDENHMIYYDAGIADALYYERK